MAKRSNHKDKYLKLPLYKGLQEKCEVEICRNMCAPWQFLKAYEVVKALATLEGRDVNHPLLREFERICEKVKEEANEQNEKV